MARLEMPAVLVEACHGDEELLAWVGTLRESWQREIAKHVMEPVSAEARQRRAEAMAERLLNTMKAEEELPPMLGMRLRGTRFAMEGWQKMAVNCRRDYLMAVFGAKGEQARENQVRRMVKACVEGGKKPGA